jgi:glutamine synthetase
VLPRLPRHSGDRNRTSPFAFTGNKFEFRAVGASQTISWPATVLNTVIAESIDEMCTELEPELEKGTSLEEALRALLGRVVGEHQRILFNGDGYSEDWQEEAARRGLLNIRNSVEALELLTSEKNSALFEKYGVLSRRELASRQEIFFEQYFKTINIEGETTEAIGRTMILPSAVRYLNELLAVGERGAAQGFELSGAKRTIEQVNTLVNELVEALDELGRQNAELGGEEVESKAHHMRDNIVPAMAAVRSAADRLEKVTPDDFWPLPTYRDMLFVK